MIHVFDMGQLMTERIDQPGSWQEGSASTSEDQFNSFSVIPISPSEDFVVFVLNAKDQASIAAIGPVRVFALTHLLQTVDSKTVSLHNGLHLRSQSAYELPRIVRRVENGYEIDVRIRISLSFIQTKVNHGRIHLREPVSLWVKM